ncbi:hypothetical protein [Marinospirillum sp.]|uniref:hypothetical protein n=1 Tax=Marinospirillum sp. TaxID=2183934 RepID=UPI0028702909|nr:hypothetical protein [Marinospirillum sp.]MDR9467741.1 hypothetical protein [Marinospirillum sp.]
MLSLLALVAAFADLLIWRFLPSGWQDWLFFPLLFFVTWVIFNLRLDLARQKRQVWLAQYLNAESSLVRRLQVGWLGVISQLLASLLLALLLLLQVLLVSPWLLLVLASSLLALPALEKILSERLGAAIQPAYRKLLFCRWLVIANTLVLTLLLMLAFIYQPQPWLVGMSWSQAMTEYLDVSRSGELLGFLERSVQLLDLTQKWALQNFVGNLEQAGWLGLLTWLLLAGVMASLALATSYWLVAADYLIRGLDDKQSTDTEHS